MDRLQSLPPEQIRERELSVLENLLLKNDDPKIPVAMAIDMITAGIDTVSYTMILIRREHINMESEMTASKMNHLDFPCEKETIRNLHSENKLAEILVSKTDPVAISSLNNRLHTPFWDR